MRLPFALAVLVGALLATSTRGSRVHAQQRHDFSTMRYRPAVGPGNYFGVESAQTGAHLSLTYGLAFDYSAKTLNVDHPCRGLSNLKDCPGQDRNFVQKTGLAHALFGIALRGNTLLSFDLPIGATDASPLFYDVNNVGNANPQREIKPKDGFVLGDLRAQAKTRVYRSHDDKLRVAAAVFTTLPTGMITSGQNCTKAEQCSYMGERGVQAGAFGIVDYQVLAKLRVSGNLGITYRPKRDFLGTEVSSELAFGGAAAYEILPDFNAKAELVGALAMLGNHDVPLEARGGLSYGHDLVVTAGAGAGIVGDVGSPTFRVLAGVQYTPVFRDADYDGFADERDRCPNVPEDKDGFQDSDGCPDLDDDNDRVPDAQDRCKNEPEDYDGFQDEDGCPDPDNDGDGVPDGYDSCEGQKEDIDGDRDDDGCPDLDTDRDGVPDAQDRCPNAAEDTDGLGDEDGCPETDQDDDGILDTDDQCPEEPETKNGKDDADGCPE